MDEKDSEYASLSGGEEDEGVDEEAVVMAEVWSDNIYM